MKRYTITLTIDEENGEAHSKCIENYTEEELTTLLPNISKDIIHLVFGYLHRSTTETAFAFSRKNNISESLMYKYLRKVKNSLKNSSQKV